MKSFEFVKSKIDLLVTEYPNIKCTYEHDVFANIHLVEVVPTDVYTENIEYAATESEIITDFIALYPNENICFITDTSLAKIKVPNFTKEGILFGASDRARHSGIYLGTSHHGTQAYIAFGGFSPLVQVIPPVLFATDPNNLVDENTLLEAGEYKYAMAA